MAVNWNIKHCPKKNLIQSSAVPNALFDTLVIWGPFAIGYSEITENNIDTILHRYKQYEGIVGAYLTNDGKPRPITRKDLELFIGLSTNHTVLTDSQFDRKLKKIANQKENENEKHNT